VNKELEELRNAVVQYDEEIKRLEHDHKQEIKDLTEQSKMHTETITKLSDRIKEQELSQQNEKLRRSGYRRLAVVAVIFVSIVLFLAYESYSILIKKNFIDKLSAVGIILAPATGVSLIIGWFYIEKERFGAMNWSISKLFKADDSK